MHSHQGLQEQLLMAAPLIIHDQRDRPDQQEVVRHAGRFQLHAARADIRRAEERRSMAGMAGSAGGYAGLSDGVNGQA